MTFSAIFDESGTHESSELIVFGGLIAHQEELNKLSHEWNRRLEEFDRSVTFFHMVEFNRRYQTSTESERQKLDSLVSDLADMICERVTEGCLNSITASEFKALPQEQRKRYNNPFYYAFEAGISALAKASQSPADNISLTCDDSDDAEKCLAAFKRLKRLHPHMVAKLSCISFTDDKFYPPLQAADMFAYCYRAELVSAAPGLWQKPRAIIKSAFADVEKSEIRLENDEVV